MSRAIVIGETEFRDLYADGNIRFVVIKDMGNGTYQCISVDEDYDGIERYYSAAQIRQKVEYARNLERVFADKDDWWNAQKVGAVLHYHNSHGSYIRGTVIEIDGKKMLRPTALVGNWHSHDLPQRRPNGEIYYPYNADKIVNASDKEAAWQPHESCVFENSRFSGPGARFDVGDPSKLAPIDLTVPEMTHAEEIQAKMEQSIQRVQRMISERHSSCLPAITLLNKIKDEAETAIDTALRTR